VCRDVIKDLLVASLRRNRINDGFGAGLSGSLGRSTVRACLNSVRYPKTARTANLLSSRIRVLKSHSLVLVPSATIQEVLGFEP